MRSQLFCIVLLFVWTHVSQASPTKLVAQSEPIIQNQIDRVYSSFKSGVDPRSNVETFQEVQVLKGLVSDKGEIVEQVAIFATGEGEDRPLMALGILHLLDLPPKIVIPVLAPYLNADDRNLRSFVRDWFQSHDNAAAPGPGLPPLQPINYEDYKDYVHSKITRNEEIPVSFIEYVYNRNPGKALLVFIYADRQTDVTNRLQAIREALQAARDGREKSPDEVRQQRERMRQRDVRQQQTKEDQREILLAEHIIGNAIWLKQNGFDERFQKSLPEAASQLLKLSKHDEWWARLYVAEMMRQHPELRQRTVVEQLRDDSNALVSKVARATQE